MISGRVYGKFHGVYLLSSLHPIRPRTYIGFTVEPDRRLKQHNGGLDEGGAKKTNNKGPWEMVLIVHGFPNEYMALKFEWAWQNPAVSRRLRHTVDRRMNSETSLGFNLRVLEVMLRTRPWSRLGLNLKFLQDSLPSKSFREALTRHRVILSCYEKNYALSKTPSLDLNTGYCYICLGNPIEDMRYFGCLNEDCNATFHSNCLGQYLLKSEIGELIPVQGTCPKCSHSILWVDIVTVFLKSQ